MFDAVHFLDYDAVVQFLRKRGICILRYLFPTGVMSEISTRAEPYLERSAIAGVPVYWKVDHPKKLGCHQKQGLCAHDCLFDDYIYCVQLG